MAIKTEILTIVIRFYIKLSKILNVDTMKAKKSLNIF